MDKLRDIFKTKRIPSEVDDGLETLDEYRARWRSVYIIYYTMFLMSLGFSIILTGVWPYLIKLDPYASKEFMAFIVAANPLGQMMFSPLFGWWSNKIGSIRMPMQSSLVLFTLANGVYSSLEWGPPNVKYWMLMSRFLVGVSSSNIAVCRSHVSAATRVCERTKAVSMVSLAQVLGFIVGPALQIFVTPLGSDGLSLFNGAFVLNMYTACGWINVIMSILNFIMFMPSVFKDHKIAAREIMVLQGKTSERETWKAIKPDYVSAWTLIVAFFVLVFNFVLLETLGTPLVMDQFAWTNSEATYYVAMLMCVGAVVALVTFAGITPLCKIYPERYVLIWGGMFLMVIGRILYIPWGSEPPKLAEVYNVTIPITGNHTIDPNITDSIFLGCPKTQHWCATTNALTISQFLIGYAMTSIGYPIGVTLIQTIFSKMLGPRPQGVWMGFMTSSGCLSRVLGPICVGFVYTELGTYYTFGFTTLMMLLSMIWLLIWNKHLIPPNYENTNETDIEMVEPHEQINNVEKENLDLREESIEIANPKLLESDDIDFLLKDNKKATIVATNSKT